MDLIPIIKQTICESGKSCDFDWSFNPPRCRDCNSEFLYSIEKEKPPHEPSVWEKLIAINKLELTDKNIEFRRRQLEKGFETEGFKNYMKLPREQRRIKVPDIFRRCSRRNWLGEYRKWRKMLHRYDNVY